MFEHLADAAGTSEKVLIYTLVGGHIATIAGLVIKALVDQFNRLQDRLDAETKTRILLAEGNRRERRISDKIEENTKVNVEALNAANGHNQKIAELHERVTLVVEKGTETQQPHE